MTTTLERTVLPSEDRADLDAFRHIAAARAGTARLVLEDGTEIRLPAELAEMLQVVATVLQEGRAVTVAPIDTTLTTQQAADMLGVSRPTLVALLERGGIPFTKPGRHRRILLTDLLAYRDDLRAQQTRNLDELAAISQNAGLDNDAHHRRRLRR